MKLLKYLKMSETTHEAFAALVGISRAHVTRLANGERLPSARLSRKIADATEGAVMPNDWIDDPEPPSSGKARPRKAKANPKRPLVAA